MTKCFRDEGGTKISRKDAKTQRKGKVISSVEPFLIIGAMTGG